MVNNLCMTSVLQRLDIVDRDMFDMLFVSLDCCIYLIHISCIFHCHLNRNILLLHNTDIAFHSHNMPSYICYILLFDYCILNNSHHMIYNSFDHFDLDTFLLHTLYNSLLYSYSNMFQHHRSYMLCHCSCILSHIQHTFLY